MRLCMRRLPECARRLIPSSTWSRMMKNSVADKWGCSSNGIGLGNDDLHVWKVSLDQDKTTILKMSALLAPDECRRAEKYFRSIDRDRFIIARGVLRKILSAYLRISPYEL